MSARLSSAATAVPATKPICTPVVSHPACAASRLHSAWSLGATALEVNHTDMAIISAAQTMPSVRRRCRTARALTRSAPCGGPSPALAPGRLQEHGVAVGEEAVPLAHGLGVGAPDCVA